MRNLRSFGCASGHAFVRLMVQKKLLFINTERKRQLMNATFDLRTQVQAALMQDSLMKDYGIEVLDSNGIITLRGTVPTRATRERAEEIVRTVEGVTSVINELDVV